MARKRRLPGVDEQALDELAKQFPGSQDQPAAADQGAETGEDVAPEDVAPEDVAPAGGDISAESADPAPEPPIESDPEPPAPAATAEADVPASTTAPDVRDAPVSGATGNGAPLIVAIGIGGRLELMDDRVRLIKDNVLGTVVNLLGLGYGKVNKTITITEISTISIVRPILVPDFIKFTYPGSPESTGKFLKDAFAENALIMNIVDNRRFYELKDRVDQLRRRTAAGAGKTS